MLQVDANYPLVISDPHHTMRPQIDILSDPDTTILQDVPFTAGSVQADRTATNLRQINATVVDADWRWRLGQQLTPDSPGQPFTPYGALIKATFWVWSYALPTPLRVPAGLFRLSDAKVVGDGTLTCVGYDFSRTVQRNLYTAPYVIPAGTNYVTAICQVIQDRLGGLYMPGAIGTTDEVTPLMTFDAQDDPWEHASSMADAIGFQLYFDTLGQFCLLPVVDPGAAEVVATYDEDGGMLLDADIDRSDEDGYNGVVMTSESTTLTTPISSTVWDTNPSSPTYYLGPYGQVAAFQSSPYIGSQAQADAAAQKWLADNLGGTEVVTMSTILNPAHEPGDAVHIQKTRSAIDDVYLLDSFEMSFEAADSMPSTTRKRRSISGLVTV